MAILDKFFKKQSKSDELLDPDSMPDLNLEKKDMIRGIVELSETPVKEVMVPRIDVVFLENEIEKKELFEKVIDSGHSRFPVYEETIDSVVGILYAKDLLAAAATDTNPSLSKLVREPYFVPESMKLDSLLRELKQRRVHIAIVVDEYGGVSGIVCMEDIIEEILGDIQDEFDHEKDDILDIGSGAYLCDARVNMEDLNDALGVDLSDEDCDTLGGYVFDLFGKIPVLYEKVSNGNLDFIIQSVEGHKIKTVKIVKRDAVDKV